MPREATNAGWIRSHISLRLIVASGTSAEEYATDLVLGHRFWLEKVWFIAFGDGAGAGATRLFRVIKGTATVAASATIALADTQTKGLFKAFTLSTTPSDYFFSDDDTLSIDVTAAGTQFTTLTGQLTLQLRHRAQQQ